MSFTMLTILSILTIQLEIVCLEFVVIYFVVRPRLYQRYFGLVVQTFLLSISASK